VLDYLTAYHPQEPLVEVMMQQYRSL